MSIDQNTLRDLQLLAAKVAGLTIRGYDYGTPGRHAAVLIDTGAREPSRWSSWHNDGDAFRLMVDLGLPTHPPRTERETAICGCFSASGDYSPRILMRMAVTNAAAAEALNRGLTA